MIPGRVLGGSRQALSSPLNRAASTTDCTPANAAEMLHEHVDGTWDDDLLTVPKIVLLAEDFTAQTYTTGCPLGGPPQKPNGNSTA